MNTTSRNLLPCLLLALSELWLNAPPTLSAMGQNRQKLGNNCLFTPSARSGRMGPQ